MAGEIIALERRGGIQHFAFYYPIPLAIRKEIGAGTAYATGTYPVVTATNTLCAELKAVLEASEMTALSNGSAMLRMVDFKVEGFSNGTILTLAREEYAAFQIKAAAEYAERFAYIGRRLDKE